MEVENSMECKLSLNSYKIRFVKGSEDYLYRRQALKRAKEVSCSCRNSTKDDIQQETLKIVCCRQEAVE